MRKDAILLVDTDEEVRSFLNSFASEEMIDVHFADSAQEALELIKETHFRVIVTEYQVGEMTGLDLIKRVNLKKVNIPIILLTSYHETRLIRDAWFSGAFDFLEKPISKERLFESLFLGMKFGVKELDRYKYSRQLKEAQKYMDQTENEIGESIDLMILKNLYDVLGYEIFKQVIEGFKTQMDEDIQQVKAIAESQGFDQAGQLYRRSGEAAKNLGLNNIFSICSELELYSAVYDFRCFELEKLENCIEKSVQFMNKYLEDSLSKKKTSA